MSILNVTCNTNIWFSWWGGGQATLVSYIAYCMYTCTMSTIYLDVVSAWFHNFHGNLSVIIPFLTFLSLYHVYHVWQGNMSDTLPSLICYHNLNSQPCYECNPKKWLRSVQILCHPFLACLALPLPPPLWSNMILK